MDLQSVFSEDELDLLAQKTKFIQRATTSKITGSNFLDIVIMNSDKLVGQSLNDLCIDLKQKYRVNISKQSLNDRFNLYAVKFLKSILESLLKTQITDVPIMTKFKTFRRVLIKDSTCFQIDKSLSKDYPGSGGASSKASIRIQFEYDVLNGEIVDLTLNGFTEQDAKDSRKTIELVKNQDLVIRDLAYMHFDILEKIDKELDAFFLCRLTQGVNVYEMIDEKYVKIDFSDILTFMKNNKIDMLEKEIFLLFESKLCMRLIIYLLPDSVVSERMRSKNAENNKKGRTLSKKYKIRAQFNLMITNTSVEDIPADMVYTLYRVRWQIELVFKIWKSIGGIDKVKKVKKDRFECYIFSKLLFILLAWQFYWNIASETYKRKNIIISPMKFIKTIYRSIEKLRSVIILQNEAIDKYIISLYDLCESNLALEKKKHGIDPVFKIIEKLIFKNNAKLELA